LNLALAIAEMDADHSESEASEPEVNCQSTDSCVAIWQEWSQKKMDLCIMSNIESGCGLCAFIQRGTESSPPSSGCSKMCIAIQSEMARIFTNKGFAQLVNLLRKIINPCRPPDRKRL
jgi:hypothetical protein